MDREGSCDNIYLFQGQVGSLRIAGHIALGEIVVLVKTDLYLLVFLFFYNHRPCGKVAKSLVVAGEYHHDESHVTGHWSVNHKQQPAHQIGTQRGA